MKVLITGGAGYIGIELAKTLNNDSNIDEIIIYDNLWNTNYNIFLHSKIKKGKVKFVEGELLDSRKLSEVLNGVDVVYHLAARVAARLVNASHHLYEQINNWGTAELVYAVEESNVSKFVYVSSIAVYGDSKEIITENTIANPSTYYGASKLRGEEHVERLKNKIQTYILRTGNVYGYGVNMRMDTVINKFVFDSIFKNKIKILGDGKQKRSFIHVDKVACVLKNIISSNLKSSTYNLVDSSYSILDLAYILKEISPELEMLFINQHLELRNLEILPEAKIKNLCNVKNTNIKDDLVKMINSFYNSSM